MATDDLNKLGTEITRLQEKTALKAPKAPQGAGLAMQVGLELVCGVLVGLGIGIALDRWLGTTPWLLITCFFLGAAGGALTLWRTVAGLPEDSADEESKNGK